MRVCVCECEMLATYAAQPLDTGHLVVMPYDCMRPAPSSRLADDPAEQLTQPSRATPAPSLPPRSHTLTLRTAGLLPGDHLCCLGRLLQCWGGEGGSGMSDQARRTRA